MNLNEYMYKQDDHMTLSLCQSLSILHLHPYPPLLEPYPLPHPYLTPKLHGVLNERVTLTLWQNVCLSGEGYITCRVLLQVWDSEGISRKY